MPALRWCPILAGALDPSGVPQVRTPNLGDGGDDLPRHAQAAGGLVSGYVLGHHAEEWRQRRGAAKGARAGELQDRLDLAPQAASSDGPAWPRPSVGLVEVDETYLGGLEEGKRGRQTERKSLIVIAAQEDGSGIGRIRMKRIPDASANSLMDFVKEGIEPGSTVHADGWVGYDPLEGRG